MPLRSLEQITKELTDAVQAGEIRNVDYKDIADDANRGCAKAENGLPLGYHDEIKVLPNAEKLYDFTHLPYSVLHLAGWIERASKHEGSHPAIDTRIALAKQWAPVADLLLAARPLIVKGRKPRDPATIPARSDNLCSCCGRQIELVKRAKDGKDVIAHHGYERPSGKGWQTSSCVGARFQAYHTEEGRDRLSWLINDVIKPQLASSKEHLKRLNAGPHALRVYRDRYHEGKPVWIGGRRAQELVTITPDHKDFAQELRFAIARVEGEVRRTERDLKDQQKRLADWPGKEAK